MLNVYVFFPKKTTHKLSVCTIKNGKLNVAVHPQLLPRFRLAYQYDCACEGAGGNLCTYMYTLHAFMNVCV